MSHIMKSATVRDLRYNFPEIEARLQRGEEIEIRKRKRVIARLVPVRPKLEKYPDFEAHWSGDLRRQDRRADGRRACSLGTGPLLKAYADTSLLISLYGRDANTFAAVSLARSHRPTFFLTPFGEAEFINAIEIRIFQEQWTRAEAQTMQDRFRFHLSAGVFQLQELSHEIWPLAMTLSRRHSAKLGTHSGRSPRGLSPDPQARYLPDLR
jgi:antitoxin (DNA-binding transcriptional repressor) of toxin-antitoxin stability system